MTSLNVDDISLFCKSSSLNTLQCQLQVAICNMADWRCPCFTHLLTLLMPMQMCLHTHCKVTHRYLQLSSSPSQKIQLLHDMSFHSYFVTVACRNSSGANVLGLYIWKETYCYRSYILWPTILRTNFHFMQFYCWNKNFCLPLRSCYYILFFVYLCFSMLLCHLLNLFSHSILKFLDYFCSFIWW